MEGLEDAVRARAELRALEARLGDAKAACAAATRARCCGYGGRQFGG